MSTSGGGCGGSAAPARRPSRYGSQKRRDWQKFVRYLAAHRPPLVLRRCSGAHVLEFLRYLDRFGKTRVHAPPCPAYGVRATSTATAPACQCPLRQAWGSLDALVGRLRAAFDERHGCGAAGGEGQQSSQQQQHDPNPFAERAVRLYLRDVRDAQSRARGVSYHKKKKKKSKAGGSKAAAPAPSASSASLKNGCADADGECPRACGHNKMTTRANAAPASPPRPPLPPGLAGVPFDQCCDLGTIVGGGGSCYSAGGIFLPLLFNAFS